MKESYSLSSRAQEDIVLIYKFGIKYFGPDRSRKYLEGLIQLLDEIGRRPELDRNVPQLAMNLKRHRYKAHVLFYTRDEGDHVFIVRVLGKRMNFLEHI